MCYNIERGGHMDIFLLDKLKKNFYAEFGSDITNILLENKITVEKQNSIILSINKVTEAIFSQTKIEEQVISIMSETFSKEIIIVQNNTIKNKKVPLINKELERTKYEKSGLLSNFSFDSKPI